MEYIKLIGILIIVLGFIFKLNIIFTVVLSGFITALVSGLSVGEFLDIYYNASSNWIIGRAWSEASCRKYSKEKRKLVSWSPSYSLSCL